MGPPLLTYPAALRPPFCPCMYNLEVPTWFYSTCRLFFLCRSRYTAYYLMETYLLPTEICTDICLKELSLDQILSRFHGMETHSRIAPVLRSMWVFLCFYCIRCSLWCFLLSSAFHPHTIPFYLTLPYLPRLHPGVGLLTKTRESIRW